jgi:type I restriction enzyme, S subunit
MSPGRLLQHFEQISEAPEAVPRLRQFILDLAVRGKLVDQDPADEPAPELLKRIWSEKERLASNGSIRRSHPQPEVSEDEVPYILPKGWISSRLGDVIHLVSGQHLQPNEYSDRKQSGPPYITGPADFGEKGLVITRYATVRKAVATEDQILLTVKGAGVGKTAICDLPEVAISRQLMAMTAIQWSQRFLLLIAHRLAVALRESSRSLIPGISRDDVERFVFGLPPLAEQHRIVAKADELLALCDELEAAQAKRERRRDRLVAATLHGLSNGDATVESGARPPFEASARFYFNHLPRLTTRPEHIHQLRQTILNLAVRGKLVPQDPRDEPATELVKQIEADKAQHAKEGKLPRPSPITLLNAEDLPCGIPANWRWCRLAELCLRIQYGYTASANPSLQEVRLLRITDIQDNRVRWESVPGCDISSEQVDQYLLADGDVLIARTGGTIGKSFLVEDIPLRAVFASYLIRIQGSRKLFDRYLKLFLESPVYWEQLKIGARGTGQPNVNGQTLGSMAVPLPPLAEQHRIVAKVDELMALCDELETRLTTTATTRRQLLEATLQEALEGRSAALV